MSDNPGFAMMIREHMESEADRIAAIVAERVPGVYYFADDKPLLTIREDDSVEFGEGVSQGEIVRRLMAATAKHAMLLVAESVDKALQDFA
jgi:hypothetical protein